MARHELDFSVDLEMLPETDFSPFEQCLFLLNNLEGVQEKRKNALKSALIMSECEENELKTIIEVFLDTREPDFFISSIERLTQRRRHEPVALNEVRSSLGNAIHEESVNQELPSSRTGSRLLESPHTQDSFLIELEDQEFIRPTKKAIKGQNSLLADLEHSRDTHRRDPLPKQPSVEQNFSSIQLPLQSPGYSSHQSQKSSLQNTRKFKTKETSAPPARKVLNTTDHIKKTYTRIEDAVANFRAILSGNKTPTSAPTPPSFSVPPPKPVNCSANVTIQHLKSPFKKDFHSFLGDELISPIRPPSNRAPSVFTKSESRVNTVQTENYEMPLLSPLQKQPDQFNQKTLGLATGLRYVKSADLLFLLEDYTPDKEMTRKEFFSMISLLRESVIGNDAPLPPAMFETAILQIWNLIKAAQDLLETHERGEQEDSSQSEEEIANVIVVGPALLLLSKGTVEEKLDGMIEIVSKGGSEVSWLQLAGLLHEIFEVIYKLESVPKVIKDKATTTDLGKYCAESVFDAQGLNMECEKVCMKVIDKWLGNPVSLEETMTDIDPSDSCLMSNESSMTCGITFRDSIIFKTFGDMKKKEKQKPEQVPKLDLSNTQGIKVLQEKCEKIIANADKIHQKKPSITQPKESERPKERSVEYERPKEVERPIERPREPVITINKEEPEKKSTARGSRSLVPLPSHRAKVMISPQRRRVPDAVKRFQKLRVIELEESQVTMRMTHSLKISPPREEAKHYKCSSMFVQSSAIENHKDIELPSLGDQSQQSEDKTEVESNKCSEIKLSIVCSPKKDQDAQVHILAPKTTMNRVNPEKQDDEVRFSTESWVTKTPPGRSEVRSSKVAAPKVLNFCVKNNGLNESAIQTNSKSLLLKQNASNSSFSSVNASLATFAAPIGSPEKRRNIKIAVLDYFLKH